MTSKRKAQPGDRVVVTINPESGRLADVVRTDDGRRVFVRVIETDNQLWLGNDEWDWPA